jgi:anti-sigma factor RsiW
MHATKVREPKMSDCHAIQGRLGRYFDGELSPVEHRLVEDHLKHCGRCSQDLQEIRAIVEAFQEGMSVPPVPSDLNRRIMAKARVQAERVPSVWSFLWFWKSWSFSMRLAAMGVAAAACYVGLIIGDSSQPSTRSTGAEIKWIGMTSQGPIVKAYIGSAQ